MSNPNVTAKWDGDKLLTTLARSGWGDLSGRALQGARSTLRGLLDLLPFGSAQGMATAAQIADASGLSERWVRSRLHLLEDAGIVEWTRGGVIAGKPTPSYFRISKRVLVTLIKGARPVLAAVQRARAEATARRVSGLKFVRSPARGFRASSHAALSASPSPKGKDRRDSVPPSWTEMPLQIDEKTSAVYSSGRAAVDAILAARRRLA